MRWFVQILTFAVTGLYPAGEGGGGSVEEAIWGVIV